MAKSFLFVCGDIGSTKMMVPVAQELTNLGHQVSFVADGEGIGYQVLLEARIGFEVQFKSASGLCHVPADGTDLVFISTCASANKVEKSYARAFYGIKPVVFGADGFFNHGYKWCEDIADFWFAINEAHAGAIRFLRPQLDPDRVKVVGQPAFDPLLELIPRKEQIRKDERQALGIQDDEKVFLWFSQGMPEVIEEDLEMMEQGIEAMNAVPKPVFIPRVHPKLDKIRIGYFQGIHSKLKEVCFRNRARLVRADNLSGEELCLASDVVISITATDDIKNWLMGGPPVIHLMGSRVRQWFEESLRLNPPDYLPDVQAGEALAVRTADDWSSAISDALDQEKFPVLRRNWQMPEASATDRAANALIEIVS
ncbi:MAG: hypothetical protein G01um10142_541 [Parcubacteria group bacterium Gr01-1014_2]|nr:MAG: hypothetical protein G01um10142_541 [Parcubacteria group bacterium Gr01-1014_2]